MTLGVHTLAKKKAPKSEVPEQLIYEMYKGQPIYYKGYREVLSGQKTPEQIMGDSSLQSWLKTKLTIILAPFLESAGYELFAGELGITFEKKEWRAADIAIYKIGTLELTNQYAKTAPEIAIEIDVQADTQALGGDMKYITEKTNQYLKNGVKKVIWIFTNAGGLMEASEMDEFRLSSWDKDLEIMEGITINIFQLLENRHKTTA